MKETTHYSVEFKGTEEQISSLESFLEEGNVPVAMFILGENEAIISLTAGGVDKVEEHAKLIGKKLGELGVPTYDYVVVKAHTERMQMSTANAGTFAATQRITH